MNEQEFLEKVAYLSNEFSRYVLEHPEIEDAIPVDAQIVFIIEDEPNFTRLMKEYAKNQHIDGQPVVYIKLRSFPPKRISSITSPSLEVVPNI
jgi:hypothetical protein